MATAVLSLALLASCAEEDIPVLDIPNDKRLVFVDDPNVNYKWQKDLSYAFEFTPGIVHVNLLSFARECYENGSYVYLYGNDLSLLEFASFFKTGEGFHTASYSMEDENRSFLKGMDIYAEGDIVVIGGQKGYSNSHIPSISFCHTQEDLTEDTLKRIVYNDFVNQIPDKSTSEHQYSVPFSLNAYSVIYYLYPDNDPSFESYLAGGVMVWQDLSDQDRDQNFYGIGTNLIPVTNGIEPYNYTLITQRLQARCDVMSFSVDSNEWDMDIRNADTLSDRDISGLAKPEKTFDEFQGATISWKNDDGLLRDVVLTLGAHFNQAEGNDIQLEIDLQATFKGLDTGSVGIALTGEEPYQYPDEIG